MPEVLEATFSQLLDTINSSTSMPEVLEATFSQLLDTINSSTSMPEVLEGGAVHILIQFKIINPLIKGIIVFVFQNLI
jgi:hypothetical protein